MDNTNIVKEQSDRTYKYSKQVYLDCKNLIKKISNDQKVAKYQGSNSVIEPYSFEFYKIMNWHPDNRRKVLRVMYAVYHEIRGKEVESKMMVESYGHMKNKTFSKGIKLELCALHTNILAHLTGIATIDTEDQKILN